MFQLVASAASAFNQAVIFAGALLCWALGGFLVGNALYWRRHAVPVQGQVIGVRPNGNCLNAVYRYESATGETFEATSLEGSSSTRGKETGCQVPLWVIPEKPNEVQEADNHLFTVIGAVFLGFGGVLFWFGATAWPLTSMTWVVGGLLAAHLVWKLRSLFLPRDAALSRTGWRALPDLLKTNGPADAGPADLAPVRALPPVQRLEELSAPPGSRRERQSRMRAQLVRLVPMLLVAGVGMIVLGAYISMSASTSSNNGTTYHAVVSYCDNAGRTVVFRDGTGTNPPTHRVGDVVTVLFQPGDPPHAIIDRGVWNWLPEVVLYLLGGAFVAGGLAAWRGQSALAAPAADDTGVRTGQS